MASICVTGGTGYIGSRLVPLLTKREHQVRAVVRPGSEKKLPTNVLPIVADPLQENSYTESVRGCDTFVHLIGVPHPSPAKAAQFRAIDLLSIQVAVNTARDAEVRHFVYLSVAQPAPMMEAFIAVRAEGEALVPCALLPFYWIAELLPPARESAKRLGLITISQMLRALVWSIENPSDGIRILDVPKIRELSRSTPS